MPKRIRKLPTKKGKGFGHYLKKGLEVGALGTVQFVPGLDVAADAAVAGEAVEGAAVVGGKDYFKQKASSYMNPMNFRPPPPLQYRQPIQEYPYYPQYRQPMMPQQIGEGYRQPYYPPPKKPLLGPLEKKILMYGAIFLIICIIGIIVIRVISHKVDGYYHSYTGCHHSNHGSCHHSYSGHTCC